MDEQELVEKHIPKILDYLGIDLYKKITLTRREQIIFLSDLISSLEGSLSGSNTKKWLESPQELLGNKAPIDLFFLDWDPNSEEARFILSLVSIGDSKDKT